MYRRGNQMAPQLTMGLPMPSHDLYPVRREENSEQSNQQRGFMGTNIGGHTQSYNFNAPGGNQTLQLHLNNTHNQIMNRPTNLLGGVHHDVHWYEKTNPNQPNKDHQN